MNETSKAMRRRWQEYEINKFLSWPDIFRGRGIDVGCGDDPVTVIGTTKFDIVNGNAEQLSRYFPENTFDWLHASQCLEHMADPQTALAEWIKVVRPGGYLVITVPSWELYEKEVWPSQFNGDHKSAWSMTQQSSKAAIHVHVPTFLEGLVPSVKVILLRELSVNYNPDLPAAIDQTYNESAGVEPFIEFVLRKT